MSNQKACHNCRRRRLKCDKSLPRCQKCTKTGQDCLGYGHLLCWEPGVASRGKMMGLRFDVARRAGAERQVQLCRASKPPSLLATPKDPLVQDMGFADRKYLAYYASHVCRQLVIYDTADGNPFRELISMTQVHPMLLHVIVANAALHMSNAHHVAAAVERSTLYSGAEKNALLPIQSRWSVFRNAAIYGDALAAKQRALYSLRHALMDRDAMHTDVTLATVLLLTEFELLDSGRDTWRHHINGAREIISALWKPELSGQTLMSPLRNCLISTCLIYDIIGSTLTVSTDSAPGSNINGATLSLLQDAERNNCSSFPAELLQLVQGGAELLQLSSKSSSSSASVAFLEEEALLRLKEASAFDPVSWAGLLQSRSPEDDRPKREHVAFAHRAATCIYLSRVLLVINPMVQVTHEPEAYVGDIIYHLSFISQYDGLFEASTWPALMAGAETGCVERRAWAARRFQDLWESVPWALFRGAVEVLQGIWSRKEEHADSTATRSDKYDGLRSNWLLDLRSMGVDWLII